MFKIFGLNYGFKTSPLYIFIDGPKSKIDKKQIQDVNKVVTDFEFDNLKQVFIAKNKGLANSIFYGIEKVLKIYDTIIVIEDDLI